MQGVADPPVAGVLFRRAGRAVRRRLFDDDQFEVGERLLKHALDGCGKIIGMRVEDRHHHRNAQGWAAIMSICASGKELGLSARQRTAARPSTNSAKPQHDQPAEMIGPRAMRAADGP